MPDADLLERMAELFEVSIDALLSGEKETQPPPEMGEIARQLAYINEHLARQNRIRKRIWKCVGIVLGCLLAGVILYVIAFSAFRVETDSDEQRITYEVRCTLDGEEYLYTVVCDGQYRILEAGGNAWVADHVQVEQYDDANVLLAQIEDYFELRGGTCEIAQVVTPAE